jgi:hypothetical protein
MTSRIVCSEKPCDLSEEKASSRFGPTVPCDLASASVWQEEQEGSEGLAAARKSCFPWLASPVVTRPTAPQPDAASAASRQAAGTRARRSRALSL